MVDAKTKHTDWKPQYKYTQKSDLADFIKKSACPSKDNLNRLLPWKISNGVSPRSFLVYIPPALCRDLTTKKNSTDNDQYRFWRILLAIHGYGGQPSQEINKWLDVAIELQSVIVAPQGTLTASNNRMGWNAIDCCGDPVVDKVDDLGFLDGVINVFFETLLSVKSDKIDVVRRDHFHVIATGFSNGGFLSSLLGLQRQRPWWLVGIVPTGGYQYDLKLYGDFDHSPDSEESTLGSSSNPLPLPMMAHHGGKDGVVKPDGCCASPSVDSTQSNCPMDIGIDRQTCTSIHTAFENWSRINGCKSAASLDVDESPTQGNNRNLIEAPYTCWEGKECLAPTELCIWTNEGHIWGGQFPGADLARDWMEKVFLNAESKPAVASTAEERVAFFYRKNIVFVMGFVLLCGFASYTVLSSLRRKFMKHQGQVKRKSSEDEDASIQLKTTSIERDADDDRGGVNDLERLVIT